MSPELGEHVGLVLAAPNPHQRSLQSGRGGAEEKGRRRAVREALTVSRGSGCTAFSMDVWARQKSQPSCRDSPHRVGVPGGRPPVIGVSKNPQSSQQTKSGLNLKARGNQSQGPWLPGRPARPSPLVVSPGGARGGLGSGLPALSRSQREEETHLHFKQNSEFLNSPDWTF